MSKLREITALDDHYAAAKPEQLSIADPNSEASVEGRFIYSETPAGLYEQFDPDFERIPTVQEVVKLRLWAINALVRDVAEIKTAIEKILRHEKVARELTAIRRKVATTLHNIWKVRITTSTHMVRGSGIEGQDSVFFYNGQLFDSAESAQRAHSGQLSDGGIQYNSADLEHIRDNTPDSSRLNYSQYLSARGGNFNGLNFLNHPIFSRAVGDRSLMEEYVWALQVLNLVDFYNPGLHSGWRPGEMKPGFGRPIALGLKGEAFYPPNNSTVDHCTVIIPKDTKIK